MGGWVGGRWAPSLNERGTFFDNSLLGNPRLHHKNFEKTLWPSASQFFFHKDLEIISQNHLHWSAFCFEIAMNGQITPWNCRNLAALWRQHLFVSKMITVASAVTTPAGRFCNFSLVLHGPSPTRGLSKYSIHVSLSNTCHFVKCSVCLASRLRLIIFCSESVVLQSE